MSSLKRPPSAGSGSFINRENGENNSGEAPSKRSVDFALDYFSSNDPAESTLLNVLEENTTSMASSRPRPARGHRRKASKLQQMVKQISCRKHLHWDEQVGGEKPSSRRSIPETATDSSDYNSLAHSDPHNNGIPQPSSVDRRRRGNSVTAAPMGGSQRNLNPATSSRRASLPPARDRKAPTSEFLSSLSEKLDDASEESDPQDRAATSPSPIKSPKGRHHRRLRTATTDLYDPHAQHLEALFQQPPKDTYGDIECIHNQRQEQRPSLTPAVSDLSEENDNNGDRDVEGGEDDSSSPLLRERRRRHQQPPPRVSFRKRANTYWLALLSLLGPGDIWHGIVYFLLYRVLLAVLPLLSTSALLFYCFGNPNFHFLPGDATISWWLIFATRLVLTFSLAEATQYTVEIITTRTQIIVKVAGPFVALIAMQSLGWPRLLCSWGAWTLLLMRGDHPFVKNWLWFLHIGIFSKEQNPDGGVLESEMYTRILVAMIVVGVVTAAKRTAVALYLGRRMLQHYRKPLRELLQDMKLVMEVAELAAETETEEVAKMIQEETEFQHSVRSGDPSDPRVSVASDVVLTTLKATASKIVHEKVPTFPTPTKPDDMFTKSTRSEDEGGDDLLLSDSDDSASMEVNPPTPVSNPSAFSKRSFPQRQQPTSVSGPESNGKASVRWSELKNQANPKRNSGQDRVSNPIEMRTTAGEPKRSHRSTALSNRGLDKLVPKMERWQEPETKSKKMAPSLYDILQFRKAMEFMENPYPFSSAFGAARTRKECIRASARVYRRLLRFTPGESHLHFDVVGALAYDEIGDLDEKRGQDLVRVFLPDKDDLLTQLSFISSVDHVYKQLRFLRASILNSSKIDSVLEDGFDILFYGIVALLVMTLLGLNPWPLLASFSAVMVSFAFSFGPSCAKYIEGTLMIAVRRPYDIGDRITIVSGESLTNPSSSDDTWLVEDISLSTTTLRFADTNEVSTVNNAAIANSRIVNGARSMNAIVTIAINFNVRSTQEQIEIFRIRVENFLYDRPDVWAGLVHFRNDAVSNNDGYVRYLMRVQHKKSWQDMPPIMVHKGELEKFTNTVAVDLGIVWQSPHHRFRVMELPPVVSTNLTEKAEKEGDHKEEPFMKFIKQDVGGY